MGHFRNNLAAVFFISAAYLAARAALRRWGPHMSSPAGSSRAGRLVRWIVLLRGTLVLVFVLGATRLMRFDLWAEIAAIWISLVGDGMIEARLRKQS
jgi:hypothetical protein